MTRVSFKMKLPKGCETAYKKRPTAIWPELKQLLKSKGMLQYSIFLDEESNILFAALSIEDRLQLNELSQAFRNVSMVGYTKDLMQANPESAPVVVPLKEIFLPATNQPLPC